MDFDESVSVFGVIFVIILILGVVVGGAFILKSYAPWWADKTGEAELARAEQNRQIAILEAKAKMESAEYLAQSEIKRAEGVAQANKIIGDSLKGNEDYLRYLYINGITENNQQNREIIYIPTEAGIPILEAGMRK